MVKQTLLLLFLALINLPAYANDTDKKDEKISYEEYLKELSSAQKKIDYSEKLVPHDGIHNLIPEPEQENKEQETTFEVPKGEAIDKVQIGKPIPAEDAKKLAYEKALAEKQKQQANKKPEPEQKTKDQTKTTPSHTSKGKEQVYISPSLGNINDNQGGSGQTNDVRISRPDERVRVNFGIFIGTDIKVKVSKVVTNVQGGFVGLEILREVHGRKKNLSRKSTFFAKPSAILGSDRVYLSVFKGITDEGFEFPVKGRFIADDGQAGLAGYVVNDGKTLARAGSAGTAGLAEGVIDLIPSNVGSDALKDAGKQVLKEKQLEDRYEHGRPAYVVSADPQDGYIQIEETF